MPEKVKTSKRLALLKSDINSAAVEDDYYAAGSCFANLNKRATSFPRSNSEAFSASRLMISEA